MSNADSDALISDARETHEAVNAVAMAKDRFLAGVAHELRSPLSSISGFAEILRNDDDISEKERASITELIADEARSMTFLVEDLLVAARRDVGQVRVIREPLDVVAIAERAIMMLGLSHVTLVTDQSSLFALGDPVRVGQIVRNLLLNAERYGGPDRSIRLTRDQASVLIDVADNGPEIPAQFHDSMFEPYGGGPTQTHESIGIGLSVARSLAELMNGSLKVHRIENDNVFRLRLPGA